MRLNKFIRVISSGLLEVCWIILCFLRCQSKKQEPILTKRDIDIEEPEVCFYTNKKEFFKSHSAPKWWIPTHLIYKLVICLYVDGSYNRNLHKIRINLPTITKYCQNRRIDISKEIIKTIEHEAMHAAIGNSIYYQIKKDKNSFSQIYKFEERIIEKTIYT